MGPITEYKLSEKMLIQLLKGLTVIIEQEDGSKLIFVMEEEAK